MSKSPAMGETMEGILDSGGMPSGRLTLRSTPNREIKTKAQYSKWVVEHRNEASADALRGWRGDMGEFKKQQADRFLKEQAQRVGDMQKQMSAATRPWRRRGTRTSPRARRLAQASQR